MRYMTSDEFEALKTAQQLTSSRRSNSRSAKRLWVPEGL